MPLYVSLSWNLMPLFLCPYLCMWPFLGVLLSTCLCLYLRTFLKEKSGQYHHFREITNLCGRQASKFKLSSMFFIGGRKTKKSPLFGPGTKTNWWVVLHYTGEGWYFWKCNTNKNYKTWSPGYQMAWSTTIQGQSLYPKQKNLRILKTIIVINEKITDLGSVRMQRR